VKFVIRVLQSPAGSFAFIVPGRLYRRNFGAYGFSKKYGGFSAIQGEVGIQI